MDPITHESNGSNGKAAAKADKKARSSSIDKTALIEVICVNRSPLLMDPASRDFVENVLIRGERAAPVRDMPLVDMASKKIYRGPDGKIGIPVECLLGCLRSAGRKIKVGKGAISTAKTTELFSFLTIEESFLPLLDPETMRPLPEEGSWVEDTRRGMMHNAGKDTAVGIVRPKFERWAFKCTLNVDYSGMDGLTEDHVRKLVEIGGNRVGLCSYRPTCNGPFGRFKLAESGWTVATNG